MGYKDRLHIIFWNPSIYKASRKHGASGGYQFSHRMDSANPHKMIILRRRTPMGPSPINDDTDEENNETDSDKERMQSDGDTISEQ